MQDGDAEQITSWWEFGRRGGKYGHELHLESMLCPFCTQRGSLSHAQSISKEKPNEERTMRYSLYICINCGNYVLIFSVFGYGSHDYRMLPWPLELETPADWPDDVARYWKQAKHNISTKCWDAAAVMARSAMQLALRKKGANGKKLFEEIDDLAEKRLLPPIIKEWAHELRLLGNDSAHPQPDNEPITQDDAQDVVEFLDYLLKYLFTIPHNIEQYRNRPKVGTPVSAVAISPTKSTD